ncbi:hypothetical protein P3X46_017105 [Hevea brasiliensis]|uniref:DUF4005 domain-containing protein n=1 Tax=Hevea brasiliensis TaxID=3981 RepID=A0ABQ9M171_HEVBR|nr:uncharacterized protein LOC110644631 [Hevea brasiliensis]KAJ9174031.1 hypothetical protein P3X46_017105 [Hevea brasiliensis]
MCSETSPRISFSNGLGQEDDIQIEQEPRRDTKLLESNSDFQFSICSSVVDYESSLADELFADGMILPVQVHERTTAAPNHMHGHEHPRKVSLPPLPCPSSSKENSNKEMMEIMISNSGSLEKHQSKSFWGFKRSSSLNCDIKKSLICSLPLLSRSNSTGSSVPNPKRSTCKDINKHNSQKQQQSNSLAKKLSASPASTYVYTFPQKPPLKKNYGRSHGNGVKISPVLKMPPPYIAQGAANLFGLGSLLRNGKEKNRK